MPAIVLQLFSSLFFSRFQEGKKSDAFFVVKRDLIWGRWEGVAVAFSVCSAEKSRKLLLFIWQKLNEKLSFIIL